MLRLVRTEPDLHPLITRLRRYVSLSDAEIARLEPMFAHRVSIGKKRDVILDGYESHRLHVVLSGYAARYKRGCSPTRHALI